MNGICTQPQNYQSALTKQEQPAQGSRLYKQGKRGDDEQDVGIVQRGKVDHVVEVYKEQFDYAGFGYVRKHNDTSHALHQAGVLQ